MTNSRLTIGVLFGGQSQEHEISLISARNIISAIDRKMYRVIPISIDKSGKWHWHDTTDFLSYPDDPKRIQLKPSSRQITVTPGNKPALSTATHALDIDVIFPILHGPMGEDGTMQGFLKILNIPFVGADTLGSSIGMDKDVMKRLLRDAGIETPKFRVIYPGDPIAPDTVIAQLGLPLFVKPANLGSSVGIVKVKDKKELADAIHFAARHDPKVIIESGVIGREIECAVLGNQHPVASIPGEIIPTHEFYSYAAKYIDSHGARLSIPAALDPATATLIQKTAIHAFQILCCRGMARVDFFITPQNKVLVNEINTIPGFTSISMYPKLWEASGISQTTLIDRLIRLAVDSGGDGLL